MRCLPTGKIIYLTKGFQMKKITVLLLSLIFTTAFAQIKEENKQVVLVLADSMDSTTAKMWRFEKDK